MANQMFFHMHVETGCVSQRNRECFGNRVMNGWEGQKWFHRGKSEVLVDRTQDIIALRSWGDGEVSCGTQADVSTL